MSLPANRRNDSDEASAKDILERLDAAGPKGPNTTALQLPSASTPKGKAYREALKHLQKQGKIGNVGAPSKPRYVTAEHFRPLEVAYEHIEGCARGSGIRLSSKSSLSTGSMAPYRRRSTRH